MATVLVVDDDDDLRRLYGRVLSMRGYDVIEADSVDAAFGKLAAEPDAVVLDLELPDGSGTVVLDALVRVSNPPPVVVCTSSMAGARVGQRYHVASLGKFALSEIANEVDRVIASGRRPRISRARSDSRRSRDSRQSAD